MKETLTIKNFGPFREETTFNFKRVNVLIGEQGTGKSTVAKLLAIINDVSYIVSESRNFRNELVNEGLEKLVSENSIIEFHSENYQFHFVKLKATKEFSPKLKKQIDLFNLTSEEEYISENGYSKKALLFIDILKLVTQKTYYPAERILVHLVNNNSFSFMGSKELVINQSLRKFGTAYQYSRFGVQKYNFDFLGISYEFSGEEDFVTFENDFTIELKKSASGFQSVLPLLLVLLNKSKENVDKQFCFHLIEEPELNLFPKTQYELVKFISEVINRTSNSVMYCTHSPYILTALNNLMYAYQVGQKNKTATKKIIDEKYWLNPDDVSAYYLSNGKAESIIDKETGLIEANRIDGVSDIMNKEFNDLFEIERISEK